jgi:hypothetical protein
MPSSSEITVDGSGYANRRTRSTVPPSRSSSPTAWCERLHSPAVEVLRDQPAQARVRGRVVVQHRQAVHWPTGLAQRPRVVLPPGTVARLRSSADCRDLRSFHTSRYPGQDPESQGVLVHRVARSQPRIVGHGPSVKPHGERVEPARLLGHARTYPFVGILTFRIVTRAVAQSVSSAPAIA